ncbi:MAG: DNA cytosine methyltransferase, partial [Anaerolineaceae bacterium]|nr:DNA cytosine methyltransferase [Anaerolineaceae bacterium]
VAERTFRADFPEAVFRRADIAGVDASDFDGLVEASAFHPVLFNACAPCQPFSRQRNGVAPPDDGRRGLLDHLSRFVRRFQPEAILVENEPGLRDGLLGSEIFGGLIKTLNGLGYSARHKIVRSQDYGVPQRMTLLMLPASVFGPVAFPARTHGNGSRNTEYADD